MRIRRACGTGGGQVAVAAERVCGGAGDARKSACKEPLVPPSGLSQHDTLTLPPSARSMQMNLTNKLTMVHGWGGAYVGDVPEQYLSDGTYIPPMHHHGKFSLLTVRNTSSE